MAKGWTRVGLIVSWLGVCASAGAQPLPTPAVATPQLAPGQPQALPGGPPGPMSYPGQGPPGCAPGTMTCCFADEPPCPRSCPLFHLGLDYLLWYTRKQTLPPLVTRGFIFDDIPGALGQPNTTVLLQGTQMDNPWHNGLRLNFGLGLESDWDLSLGGNVFLLEQATASRSFGPGDLQDPEVDVLARPFFDVVNGIQNADPVIVPNERTGHIDVSTARRLYGGDLNLRCNYYSSENSRFVFLLGGRWTHLEESLRIHSESTALPGFGVPGDAVTIDDNYHTRNRFYGGQVGGEYQYRLGPVSFTAAAKVAAGPVIQTLKNNGRSQLVSGFDGTVTVDTNSGLYIYPNNVGRFSQQRLCFVPEGTLNVGLDLSEYMRLSVGYTFLYLSRVIRPADQVDFRVNPQPVGETAVFEPAALPPRMQQANFWAHGFDVGLRISF